MYTDSFCLTRKEFMTRASHFFPEEIQGLESFIPLNSSPAAPEVWERCLYHYLASAHKSSITQLNVKFGSKSPPVGRLNMDKLVYK